MTGAIDRKLGASASECFKYILRQMYDKTDPWQRVETIVFPLKDLITTCFFIAAILQPLYSCRSKANG